VVLVLRFDELLKEDFNGMTKDERPKSRAGAVSVWWFAAGNDREKRKEKCRNPTPLVPNVTLAIAAFSCFLNRGLWASSVVGFAITSWKYSTGRHT
jgi:hypothetical protein